MVELRGDRREIHDTGALAFLQERKESFAHLRIRTGRSLSLDTRVLAIQAEEYSPRAFLGSWSPKSA